MAILAYSNTRKIRSVALKPVCLPANQVMSDFAGQCGLKSSSEYISTLCKCDLEAKAEGSKPKRASGQGDDNGGASCAASSAPVMPETKHWLQLLLLS